MNASLVVVVILALVVGRPIARFIGNTLGFAVGCAETVFVLMIAVGLILLLAQLLGIPVFG
ncbi:hypothetical protein [Yinghuangia soli]|uniref:Uncharacterized protein n=1 Tax=Yinghuangia soli TaxID=2908204 RepID=A0AA41TZU3_9ACTN|nr:hypothetical protein [Yinghuangia soli]MCF2527670.1 hypothetical protein [Yinghuangia soli]